MSGMVLVSLMFMQARASGHYSRPFFQEWTLRYREAKEFAHNHRARSLGSRVHALNSMSFPNSC